MTKVCVTSLSIYDKKLKQCGPCPGSYNCSACQREDLQLYVLTRARFVQQGHRSSNAPGQCSHMTTKHRKCVKSLHCQVVLAAFKGQDRESCLPLRHCTTCPSGSERRRMG